MGRAGGRGCATDAFGRRLKVCVWVPAAVCLGRGAVCVGEKCVFVFAEGNGLCVCVCCVFVFADCGGGRERWPRLSLSDQVDRRSLIRAREL